ncbi:MAG: ABC transporter permease [Coriobacteriia bacterium]|nr:ABC transporter permease [Coriobacteriia bacterium]
MVLRTALLIARKDLTQRMRDRSVFIYGLLAPLGLAVIFNFVFGPLDAATFHATYAVVNEDEGPIADAFLDMLDSLEEDGIATIVEVESAEEARERVERGAGQTGGGGETASAAFVLPANLSERVTRGEGGEIAVIGSVGAQLASQVALSVAEGFSSEVGAVEVAVRTTLEHEETHDPGAVAGLAEEVAGTGLPVTLEDVTARTRQLPQTTYMAAGMSVFFLFFTVSFGVSGLLDERRKGTLERLLAAPIDRRSIILGKAVTSFALGVASMSVLIVATTVLLGAQWGHPLGVALLVVAVVFSSMGILGVVAATARSQAQAENFQAIVSLVLAFLGGTFFQVAQAGGVLETLSLATPHAWFLRGLSDLRAGEVPAVLPAVAALLAFGLVTGGVAWPFLRRAVDR